VEIAVRTREAVLDSKSPTPERSFLPPRQQAEAEGVVGVGAQADMAVANLASPQFLSVVSTWTKSLLREGN